MSSIINIEIFIGRQFTNTNVANWLKENALEMKNSGMILEEYLRRNI